MSEEKGLAPKNSEKKQYQPPQGASLDSVISFSGKKMNYQAKAEWIVLRKNEKPNAEMFHVAYLQKESVVSERPVTFVFNGGPGASAAYLHMGALGPNRVQFNDDGTLTSPPVKLIENQDSWLEFTDLVFIDPIGTGFSRMIEDEEKDKKDSKEKKDKKEYFQMSRDLESIGEFVQKFLSKNKRWTSPVYIAGESYGGFRVAKLSKMLQNDYGIGLNGAVLISPCFDWSVLSSHDYDMDSWVNIFPTMVASAHFHKKSQLSSDHSLDEALAAAEKFTVNQYARFLIQGEAMSQEERDEVFQVYSAMTGLDLEYVKKKQGRIVIAEFVRKLLESDKKVMGLYDATITLLDPYPDRDTHQAPDSTLSASERVFCSGVNAQLRENIGIEEEREYKLLNIEVNTSWKNDKQTHAFDLKVDSADDLRYAMAMNPFLKVFITHGTHDLVTPYYAANRLVGQMRLTSEQKERLLVKHFGGGHMFYTWKDSREQFTQSMREFYRKK